MRVDTHHHPEFIHTAGGQMLLSLLVAAVLIVLAWAYVW